MLGKNRCLLHATDDNKSPSGFKLEFEDYLSTFKSKQVLNIEHIIFPIKFDLADIIWDKLESIHANGAIFKRGANFENVNLKSAYFKRADFQRFAKFKKAKFDFCDFSNAEFSGAADFREVRLSEARFNNAKFSITVFSNAQINKSSFTSAEFIDSALFMDCRFHDKTTFERSLFKKKTYFSRSKFKANISFSMAEAQGLLDFSLSAFDKADFFGGKFKNCRFIKSEFERKADFREAILGKTVFSDVEFPWGSTFKRANISDTEFLRGDIQGVFLANTIGLENCLFANPKWHYAKRFTATNQFAKRLKSYLSSNRISRICLKKFESKRRVVLADEINLLWGNSYHSSMPKKCAPTTTAYKDIERAYREIRVNLEKHKNYPEAGDFHFGEMEMRRLAKSKKRYVRTFFRLEGWYWLLSGYGERWRRAFVSFLLVILGAAAIYLWQGFITFSLNKTGTGVTHSFLLSLILSFKVAFLRADTFSQALTSTTLITMLFETILAPITLGLLILAVGRQFKRN